MLKYKSTKKIPHFKDDIEDEDHLELRSENLLKLMLFHEDLIMGTIQCKYHKGYMRANGVFKVTNPEPYFVNIRGKNYVQLAMKDGEWQGQVMLKEMEKLIFSDMDQRQELKEQGVEIEGVVEQ